MRRSVRTSVTGVPCRKVERLDAGARLVADEAVALHESREDLSEPRLVVDDQAARGRSAAAAVP
jgi:hypothetical protein